MTTMAQVTMTPMESEHNTITDVESYNHYFGWYFGEAADNGPWLDKFHAMYPDRCLGVSEYGAECILKWHSAYPENHDYTEEYATEYHHDMLKTFSTRPYLWATHVWNMFDFAADGRDEGGIQGRNNKGLVTYDRKVKKDPFYVYQAYWTTQPMIHISGSRFVDRAPGERNITVYTNCPTVTLTVNGVEAGTLEAVDHCAVFQNVDLKAGANTVTASCGEVSDTAAFNGVAEHHYAYDPPEGNDAAHRFADPQARQAPPPPPKTQKNTDANRRKTRRHNLPGMGPKSSILQSKPPQRLSLLRNHQHIHRKILQRMRSQSQRKQTHPLHGMDGPEPRRRVWRNGQTALLRLDETR